MLRALKDKNSNYLYDQKSDKIAFWEEPISVPSDSVYELKLFKEINNYKAIRPSQVASNRIQFGYEGTLAGLKLTQFLHYHRILSMPLLKNQRKIH